MKAPKRALHSPIDILSEVARDARSIWPLDESEPELLKFRENAVFRVTLAGGRSAALRIHRLRYHSDAALRSELQWMAHLRSHGIAAPEPIPSRQGDLLSHIAAADGEVRQVDCLSWLEGDALGQARVPLLHGSERLAAIFHELGRTIASMHNATARWRPPAGFQRHRWDFDGFFGRNPNWGEFHTSTLIAAEQREMVARGRLKAMDMLSDYRISDRNFGLIHADLVRENLLLRGDTVQVIDFDDCGFGWHMYDLGVALYQNQLEPAYPLIKASLLEGYSLERSLTEDDLSLLQTCVTVRAFALLGWMQSRADSDIAREAGGEISATACAVIEAYLDEG
ncbi:phosphotransferase [Mesorhizobium sp. WSM4976]|uniref:phosphotransferase enzyme family protein n=1 Tax=Mesorhizobium sp. WSM4976 TaxID=3038549 RepID=UPI0024162AE9|nr:phosphotransferase [Mesorhizobium sp. WSM4976]MDG4898565.1 phosphotransferase [Mesorhizobium sp. WSM4976]